MFTRLPWGPMPCALPARRRMCNTALAPPVCGLPWSQTMPLFEPLISVSADALSGTPVFNGTRVPVKALFDYLEAGDPLTEFLADFPNVTREHAVAVLEMARRRAI